MSLFPDELRLGITLGLNALLFFAAYRCVRQSVEDRVQAAVDACLLWYLVQYITVAGLGVMGVMSGGSIVVVGVVAAGLLLLLSGEAPHVHAGLRANVMLAGAFFLLLAYVFSVIWAWRYAPITANDSLAYQLPAAVQWLQTGKLALLPVWFFNPANSYSPLAGSTFVAWLMGPMGNDVLARFVEAPALIFLFLAVVQLCRALGANLTVAALLGLAVACARPFISQTILAKDDLPLAAFLTAAMVALSGQRLRDSLGPWRLGAAVGLLLATKFTATFSLPAIVLAIDAPWRAGWRWRKHAIAAGVAACLFMPWYVRNWACYGSPAFPFNVSILGVHLFNGPLTTIHTDRMKSLRGIIETLTGTYYSLSPMLGILMLGAWMVCLWHGRPARVSPFKKTTGGPPVPPRPLARACLWGPMVAIGLFIVRSPAAEMRFIAPSLVLVMACPAMLYPRRPMLAIIIAALLAIVSLGTGFSPLGLARLAPMAGVGLVVGVAGYASFHWLHPRGRLVLAALVVAALAGWTFIDWPSYLNVCRVEAVLAYSATYGGIADGWGTIRDQTPIDCTVAYANTFQIYPLYGFDLKRRLVYVPSKPGLERLDQMPAMRPVIGEDVPGEVSRVMMLGSNRQTWLENLKSSGAHYLLVAKLDLGDPSRAAHPPELSYAMGKKFQLIFSNDAVNVYRVNSD